MSRVFAYCRVSTSGQTTENQRNEIVAAGFAVTPRRIVEETVSGSIPASQRPEFAKLVDRLEQGDVLVVTKLDRLGRNAMDVRATIDRLAEIGVKVHCLALGGADLTSAAGRMTMQVLAAVAEFERDLLTERTMAGIRRARSAGSTFGRPRSVTDDQQRMIAQRLKEGASVSQLAREFGTSRQSILRAKERAEPVADLGDCEGPSQGSAVR
ncbi:recombinase family protein [Burkholderia thailandensis]|uniref:recombinase family protein n=1 Tax=Burkholderia thailandensis TaxID=57975 RepID=UPI0022AC4F0E|nr:recombinase family protein [Burkholderia thailandensis]MCZ2901190.1 recombinase family protein [Burkholderia thailandensis]MDD1481258.1 recombinase family protein [Burkholderia thailandensis]MDD1487923.1 recombinase family protein [Burkholderia thailandensis]MDD1494217.1 recombinase family protein [Burkholderia thailandensis]